MGANQKQRHAVLRSVSAQIQHAAYNYITKSEAITNSENWTFNEPQSDGDDDPPEADISVFGTLDEGSSSASVSSPPPCKPANDKSKSVETVSGIKRKGRAT